MTILSNTSGDPIPTDEGYRLVATDDGAEFRCDLATPVAWFPSHQLDAEYRPSWLSFDGENVRLTADNGTWVWRLTGDRYVHHYGPGTTPLVLLQGKWLD
jgi:hypothetical protein